MSWLKSIVSNHGARRTFIVLLIGFLLIQIAGVYMANLYTMRHRHQVSRRGFERQFIHTMALIDYLPAENFKKHLRLLSSPGLNKLTVSDKPLANVPTITSTQPKFLQAFAKEHYINFRANYRLKDGRWIILQGGAHPVTFIVAGFVISEVFLFILLILLCVWVVQRLAIPVFLFKQATRRFGVDLQAPPLAVQGTPEMRAVINSFNEMQGRIRRLIMDRTQMLAAISHDLRTPITRLQLRIEALKDSEHYEKAERDLNEMERMISSILSFARDYTQTEQMERFDLSALLDTICNDLEDTGMKAIFLNEPHRLSYFGRMTALKRAFTNLIENGVKYGDAVQVSLELLSRDIKIKIKDEGPGIPADQMEKVFAPFYRIDPSRTPEKSGSGLGMAVARDIIRAHGGEITLHNYDGGGLLILVTLPLAS